MGASEGAVLPDATTRIGMTRELASKEASHDAGRAPWLDRGRKQGFRLPDQLSPCGPSGKSDPLSCEQTS